MPERDSGWISGGVVDAEDARLATGVLAQAGSGPLTSRTGIRQTAGHPGLVEAAATPSAHVTVRAFQGMIQGTRAPAAGTYLVTLDASKDVDVLAGAPAHASQPRDDLIVARQFDPQYADTRTGMVVERVTGTPAATPTDPAVAGDHIRLARVRVRPGATAITATDLTDLRQFTSALGGIVVARSAADRPTNPYGGLYVHRMDTHRLEFFDGAAWRGIDDDTGWVTFPPVTNWEAVAQGTQDQAGMWVRRIGRAVYLRATLARRTSEASGGVLIGTVPAGFRPAWAHRWVSPCQGIQSANAQQFHEYSVETDGTLRVHPNPVTIPVNEVVLIHTTWVLTP